MAPQHPPGSLSVTLLAGADRALRTLVLEHLVEQARSKRALVLTFDSQRQQLDTTDSVRFRWVKSKQIQISQAGFVVPFRADLFLELNAIAQQGSTDEVFVELADNVELPSARDALVYRFPGGLYLGGIARLTRSIMVVQTVGLVEEFWEPSAGSESEVTQDPHSETAYSRAHRLARSIECADALVVDRMAAAPETSGKVVRLLRGLNPTAAIVDARLDRLEADPPAGSIDERLWSVGANDAPSRLETRRLISDTDFTRVAIRAGRPFQPQRFYQFVQGAWKGVLRGRGRVSIASQPDTWRLWSQAGAVGVLGPKMVTAQKAEATGWLQDLTFVGPQEACVKACHRLEQCLLTDEEFDLGARLWWSFVDPLREG